MLEELRSLNNPGDRQSILFFLSKIIKDRKLSRLDIFKMCKHTQCDLHLDIDALIIYASSFHWIEKSPLITLNNNILPYLNDEIKLNAILIEMTVKDLFEANLFCMELFSFDIANQSYKFHNEKFPLKLSVVRNVLMSQGFFTTMRKNGVLQFYVAKKYEKLLSIYITKNRARMKLSELKKILEKESIAGALAEEYVLKYETLRLKKSLADRVQIISNIDVGAGYDIISFQDNSSVEFDCFIEVKASSGAKEFYWSKNEIEISKLLAKNYRIYIVDLNMINNPNYKPLIIENPFELITKSDAWLIEPQSYHVRNLELN